MTTPAAWTLALRAMPSSTFSANALMCAAGLAGSNIDDVGKEIAIYRAHRGAPIVIASEGQPADEVILVRSGGMAKTRKTVDGREALVSYLMANSSIGEHGLQEGGARWAGTYTTLMPTDTLVLPIAGMREAFADEPQVLEALRKTARLIVAEEQGSNTGFYTLVAGNIGALATSGTVTVVDTLPAGMSLVSATGKFCFKPGLNDIQCYSHAQYSVAQTKDIGVIMLSAHSGGKGLMAEGCSN